MDVASRTTPQDRRRHRGPVAWSSVRPGPSGMTVDLLSMRDVPVMIWLTIAGIVTTAAIVAFLTRRPRSETVVLGQRVAVAQANEAARLAAGTVEPSPMPKGEYDQESGDYDLASVTECPLDQELRSFVRT